MTATVTDPDARTLEEVIARLSRLPETQFRQVVDRDLRRREDEERGVRTELNELESAALRSPALVDRWLTALLVASKSVEGQLSARKSDYEATKARLLRTIRRLEDKGTAGPLSTADEQKLREARDQLSQAKERYAKTRSGTLRFKAGLDEWVIEARGMRDGLRDRLFDTVVTEERNRLAERNRVLECAIRAHRDAFPSEDDPSEADEELWSLVD